jgi:hypothetical protein
VRVAGEKIARLSSGRHSRGITWEDEWRRDALPAAHVETESRLRVAFERACGSNVLGLSRRGIHLRLLWRRKGNLAHCHAEHIRYTQCKLREASHFSLVVGEILASTSLSTANTAPQNDSRSSYQKSA